MDRSCGGLKRDEKRIQNLTPLLFGDPILTYETPRDCRVIVKKLHPSLKLPDENLLISRNNKIEKVILKIIVNNLSGS